MSTSSSISRCSNICRDRPAYFGRVLSFLLGLEAGSKADLLYRTRSRSAAYFESTLQIATLSHEDLPWLLSFSVFFSASSTCFFLKRSTT